MWKKHKIYNVYLNSLTKKIEYEVIFVDDASTDGSKKLLNKLYEQKLKDYSPIKII